MSRGEEDARFSHHGSDGLAWTGLGATATRWKRNDKDILTAKSALECGVVGQL